MPRLVKELGKIAVFLAVIMIAFNVHWALGALIVVLIFGYFVYANRSTLYATRGNAAYKKGDMDKALLMMDKAYKMRLVLPQYQIGYGNLLLRTGKLEQAEQVFEEVLPRVKVRGEDWMKLKGHMATTYWLQDKRTEAIDLLEEIFKEIKNTMLYGNLGYFKMLNGQLEEALILNLEAYAYNDDDLTIMDNLAKNYYLLGRPEEAEEMYIKVMTKSPKNAESYYYYALTLQQLGRLEEAREQSIMALEKKPALVPSVAREDLERLAEQLGQA